MTSQVLETPLLQAKGISFRYGKNTPVITNLNLEIKKGEIIGITGENGAGKSTLLKLLVGLLQPQQGTIVKQGKIGYSPQELLLFENLTIMENFYVFGKGLGYAEKEIEEQAELIMKRLNFEKYRDELVKNLSGGTAQKTNFGISLLGDPDVLILDEPYQGMDYASFQAFWEIQFEMRAQGKAIVIVSHLIEDKEKFTRSLHLINGRLQGCTKIDCPICCGEECNCNGDENCNCSGDHL